MRLNSLTARLVGLVLLPFLLGAVVFVSPPPAASGAGSLQFFDEDANDNNFDARGRVTLPAEGVGINFSGNVTIEMWIAPSATAADNNYTPVAEDNTYNVEGNIILDRDLNSQDPGHIVGISAGQFYMAVLNPSSLGITVVGSTDLRDGLWHHVAATRNSSTGLIELFVDGSREESTTGPTGSLAMPDSHSPLSICGATGNVSCANSDPYLVIGQEKHELQPNGYIGLLSNLRISDSIRYSGTTYTVPSADFVDDANTLGLWLFAEQSGTTAADSSGNGQTMTLVQDTTGPQWSTATPF